MQEPRIVFDRVWKKFRRGEPHDSLRDLIPALLGRPFRSASKDHLEAEEFWALRDVSFEVKGGETLGIIGRNGAGKSTTLKLLTRILKPTLGRSEVHGRVGALIELAAGFHPDLTGRENIYLQGAIMGMKRREIDARFDEIVDFSGIAPFIDTPVKRYSSGMHARLGFSVAAHLTPDVLLIDEVLAVGDVSFQQKCYERLREFRRSGVAIAFVSHNMQAISLLCDRAVFLQPDSPPIVGPVSEVVQAYTIAQHTAGDPRVESLTCQLSTRDTGCALDGPVAPGTWLRLEVHVTPTVDLPRMGFGLTVRRVDGLVVFQSGSTMEGLPTRNVSAGEPLHLLIDFRVNLLRGTYSVEPALYDEDRHWPILYLGKPPAFVVGETNRSDGIAELEPAYQFLPLASTVQSS